jgi:hypothetical protein
MDVKGPSIQGDSLIGVVTKDGASAPFAVPLKRVGRVEVNKFSTGKTLLLVGGTALAVGLLTIFLECAGTPRGLSGSAC